MRFVFLLYATIMAGCSSGGEHTDVHTPGRTDTLHLQTDSAPATRVDGTLVDATTADTLAR